MSFSLPWNKINDFLIDCGSYRNPKEFSKQVMNQIDTLIPFDQARLYFLNDKGTVYDEYLMGVDKQVVRDYHEYYSQVDSGTYSMPKRAQKFQEHYPRVEDCIYDWSKYGSQEDFFKEYVKPNQIRHSFGLGLRDMHNTLKCLLTLDRVCDVRYTEEDIEIMRCIRSHLDNLHQVFYVSIPDDGCNVKNSIFENSPLTSRETEIAELMKQGVTPVTISKKLCISTTTVNKHISNIHIKLNVSTRQELLVKLFSY